MSEPLLIMTVIISIGALIRKIRLINYDDVRSLSMLVLDVAYPAVAFGSVGGMNGRIPIGAWHLFMAGIAISGILTLLAYLVSTSMLDLAQPDRASFVNISAQGNTIFLALPLAQLIFGPRSTIYVLMFDFGVTVVLWTLGVWVFRHSGHRTQNGPKGILSPTLIALVLSLAMNAAGVSVPGAILKAMNILGGMATPLAMIVLGATLYEAVFSLTQSPIWGTMVAAILFKLVLSPTLAILTAAWTGIDGLARAVLIMQAAMPTMVSAPTFARRYGANEAIASIGVLLTTLISLISVPLILNMAGALKAAALP